MVTESEAARKVQWDFKEAEGKKLTGAQIVWECLLREGADIVFGVPGGAVLPLYHALPEYPIHHVLTRHEQGAAHAADGYARATGRPGVCVATSGPGVTNLVTGLANAQLDSSPVIAITGNVVKAMIGRDAFQEVDATGVTLPITRHNYLVMDTADIAETIKEAFYMARTGRPGPVHIDIPRDVFQGQTVFHYPETVEVRGYKPTLQGNVRQIRQAAALINQSERPVIIAGHGVIISKAYAELRELAEKADIPVITTLLGISCFPESHPLSLGLIGMHGTMRANLAVSESDLVIGIGMRMDDRACGRFKDFAPKAKVVHIDIDPAEISKNVLATVPVVGDVRNVLTVLNREVLPSKHLPWQQQIRGWEALEPSYEGRVTKHPLPQMVMRKIWEATGSEAIMVTDVGQAQMWGAQHYIYDKPNTHITSGGLGTMGFAFPAAIGVKLGRPNEAVWVITGDGGFQMTIQELATLEQENLDIKIVVFNNGFLGMVRQWQELFYNRRYSATQLTQPDFAKIAEAYGIRGIRVEKPEDVEPAIREAASYNGPIVIDLYIEPEENVYPMVPPGAALHEVIAGPK